MVIFSAHCQIAVHLGFWGILTILLTVPLKGLNILRLKLGLH